jgi:hypothetical protein
MIDCPNCGASNKEESKFCGNCGQPLVAASEMVCPMCGTENPPESTTCSQCGARLVPLGGPPSEEQPELVEEEVAAVEGVEEEEVVEPEEVEGVLEPGAVEDIPEPEDVEGILEPGAVEDIPEPEEVEEILEPEAVEEVAEAEEAEEAPAVSEGELGEPIPPWLEKLKELPAEETPEEPKARVRLARAELPEWLEIPPDFEDMLSEVAPTVEGEELERAEIPSWLEAMRPGEAEEDAIAAEEPEGAPAESTGLLRGLKGTLAIEPALTIARRAKPLPPFSFSAFDVDRAQTFARVVKEPGRAKAKIVGPRRVEALAATTLRWIIYLIISIAVAVPILLGSNWAAANMGATAPTVAMYDAIEGLDEGAVVLISHDYTPGVAAEMIPQAEAVLNHLMERQGRLINISLTAEGSRLAQQVFEEVAEAHGYVYGEDYLNLGYMVGAEVGPRSIVEGFPRPTWTDFVEQRPFSEFPIADYVGSIEDIELIVEFAGGPEFLRLWLEQVQGPYQLPMVAGVSATADPFARPYYHNGSRKQLQGLITGLVGAAEYEWQRGQPASALASMDSQSLVHITIALLILFGNVAYFIGKLRKG